MKLSLFMSMMRWLLVLLAALLGFLASIVLAIPLNMLIHSILWANGHAMPGKDFLLYALPYDGALAASLFIQFGTYAAPSHKQLTALCLLIFGGIIAWPFVGEFYSPEHMIHHGPIRVWWPVMGTYFGGVFTFAWIWLASRQDRDFRVS